MSYPSDVGYHRRHRKDENHDEIADVFRSLGWSVWDTSQLGHGFPDMVVALGEVNILIEVKSNDAALRKSQDRFMLVWPGKTYTVRTPDDVRKIDNEIRYGHNTEGLCFHRLMI